MRQAVPTPPSRPRAVPWLVALGLLGVLLLPSPADAHAVLEGGTVADGQVLEAPPDEVRLDFNEPVTIRRGGLRVFDADGERVDAGDAAVAPDDPASVRVGLTPGVDDGTYVVTYRITSADGHPVAGALVFSVGRETGAADELVASVLSGGGDRPYALAATAVRWVLYVAVVVGAGMALVVAWLRPQVGDDDAVAVPWVRTSAWVVIAASVVGLALQNVLVSGGGVRALVDAGGLGQTLASWVGLSALVRVAGAALLWWAARGARWPVAALGAGVVLGSLLLEGHTLTTDPAVLVWIADAVHLTAAAVWAGGLMVMALLLRRRRRADDPVGAGRLVARFSWMFTWSIVAVVAAGVALAWAEVRALRALTSTAYGWALLAKLAIVTPLVGVGLWNNRRLVPVLTGRRRHRPGGSAPVPAGGSDEVAERAAARDRAWAVLRRTVAWEVALVVAVLGATSVLVALQPAAEAAGITGAFSTSAELADVGTVEVTVDPNRVGRNEIHLYLLGESGRPTDLVESVRLHLSQPELDIGPLVREPLVAGPGHWILTGPELSVPGRWEITVEAVVDRFTTESTTVEVTVNR